MKRTKYLALLLPVDQSHPMKNNGTNINAKFFREVFEALDANAESSGERINVLTAEVYLLREKLKKETRSLAFSIIILALASIINTFL